MLKVTALVMLALFTFVQKGMSKPDEKLTLWYTFPADRQQWDEYSLPIGNGELGASIFGGIDIDEIIFNEKTLWRSTKANSICLF